jgi:hypothetical protein
MCVTHMCERHNLWFYRQPLVQKLLDEVAEIPSLSNKARLNLCDCFRPYVHANFAVIVMLPLTGTAWLAGSARTLMVRFVRFSHSLTFSLLHQIRERIRFRGHRITPLSP